MPIFYRIQPRGLEVRGHYSEDSAGERVYLHAFSNAVHTLSTDAGSYDMTRRLYGDEIVVLHAPRSFVSDDVEGVGLDPKTVSVIARYTWPAWLTFLLSFGAPIKVRSMRELYRELAYRWSARLEERLEKHFMRLRRS